MSSTRIIELSSPKIGEMISDSETLILPVGSIECNGPHMPVSQDYLVAEKICAMLGERTRTLVAPTIPWGVAGALMGYPGTISIKSETLANLVKEICRSYAKHGIKKVFILNTHYYNIWPINIAIEELRSDGLYAVQVVWWSVVEKLCSDLPITKDMPNGHGGEVSTSVVLAVRDDLVDLSKVKQEKFTKGFEKDHEKDFPSVYAFDDYAKLSPNGIIGDPSHATKQEGEKIIERCLPYLEGILRDLIGME